MFNLKDVNAQMKFKIMTSEDDILSSIVNKDEDLNITTVNFIQKLKECISKCFKRVRICERPTKEIDELFKKRKALKNKTDKKKQSGA